MNGIRRFSLSLLLIGIVAVAAFLFHSRSVNAQVASPSSGKVQVDKTNVLPIYSNFARLTGTPDEVVIDFCMFADPDGDQLKPIKIDHEVVMNYYALKRLETSMQAAIAAHEKALGPIEVDVLKRVK